MEESLKIPPLEDHLSRIRARFPLIESDARGRRRIYLNTGAGSLMVDTAIEAMSAASRGMNPMPGKICDGEIETARFHEGVRSLVADFLNAGDASEISFHFSTTAALFNLAFALRPTLGRDRNIVVTDIDHMANVSPWETVGGEICGCEIRRAGIAPGGLLDTDQLLSLVDGRTAVLALTMASNGLGTIVPLAEVVTAVRKRAPGAAVCVDAVHHALHGSIDVRDIDCDFLAFSGYKVFGPMLGVLWGKRRLLEPSRPYRVETNRDEAPHKFEMGMLGNGQLGALEAALGYLLWIADELFSPGAFPDRAAKFKAAFAAISAYENRLSGRILEGFRKLPSDRLTLYGVADPGRTELRDPTFAFEIKGESAAETKSRLWSSHSVQIADGNHYSAAVTRHLKKEALCRASFAHYDTFETADRFLGALEDLTDRD
jgi:selenocysteine lyase/cysteine desulfurase